MQKFGIPVKSEVSESNQVIFDTIQKKIGFVPNLYAYFAKNDTALSDYLNLQNRKSTLKAKEKEVVNLVVSQVNGCQYCLSAHTQIGKMNGFDDEQILQIRAGAAPFDTKLDALARFTKAVAEHKGSISEELKETLFATGYSEVNMIDIIMLIGDKTISNYLHNLTEFEIDFPLAKALTEELV